MNKYYKLSVEETLKEVSSSYTGIGDDEALERLQKNGPNKLKEKKSKGIILMFLDQFKNLMLIILIISAILSAFVSVKTNESFLDSMIILVVVFTNAILGVIQENKAERAIDALKDMTIPYVKVRRNGKIESIKTEELVIGDIVILDAGDAITADMRLIKSMNIRVEESALTGESVPVDKNIQLVDSDEDIALADRTNMLYFGSNVVYGRGEAVVVATGMETELGKIAQALSNKKQDITPLQNRINELSRVLSIVVVIIAVIMFFIGYVKGNPIMEGFMLAISLAVAAIPEGLSAVITITLAIGVQKMAKENAIIRRLSAVETLGSTGVICTDKTGTLTQNRMKLRKIYTENKLLNVENVESLEDIKDINMDNLEKLIYINLLCNDTKFGENLGSKTMIGDPTETCFVEFSEKIGYDKENLDDLYERIDEIPFDSTRKLMSTINKINIDEYMVCTKGAAESIINICDKILIDGKIVKITPEIKKDILGKNDEMSKEALRVLGCAYKFVNGEYGIDEIESELIFVGLTGMIDPPRKEAKTSVEKCLNAGMVPVMITGDNINTASAIAKEIGILTDDKKAVTGIDVDNMTDEELEENVKDIRVYARVSPENKIRIVNAWKKQGKIVAMTGDGVNDAPALQGADIGISMGITGTEVAKSVSSMVLSDDNFATIIVAVKEGRRIYNNIQNVIAYLLASNLAEILIIFIATLINQVLLVPIQILWINLITDTTLAIALGFEKEERGTMRIGPRDPKESLFTPFLILRIVIPAIIKTIIVFLMYFIVNEKYGHSVASGTVFAILCFMEILFAFVCRSDKKSVFKIGLLKNKPMILIVISTILLQSVIISVSTVGAFLNIPNMPTPVIILIIVASLVSFALFEIVKLVLAKIFSK